MGLNPTLAFKTASDLFPAVMTNSWGYSISGSVLPNALKPLEAAVIEAVRDQTRIVDLKQVNRVLIQPHWRKDCDQPIA